MEPLEHLAAASFPPWDSSFRVGDQALSRLRHDLRNPLNQIIGYTEMLVESNSEKQFHKQFAEELKGLNASTIELSSMLNEGLASWKIEAGKVDLRSFRQLLSGPLTNVYRKRYLCENIARIYNIMDALGDLEKIGVACESLYRLLNEKSVIEQGDRIIDARLNDSKSPLTRPFLYDALISSTDARATSKPSNLDCTILIVEDEELNREMLTRRLQRMNFSVVSAENGRIAIELIKLRLFDLILLDILMPEFDGFETLEFLKKQERTKHIPVIMLTALEDIAVTAKCIEAGAEDYIPKPFNPVLLKARINASLEKKILRDMEFAHLRELHAERAKSEQLLLNILPDTIYQRLKSGEKVIADSIIEATVVFADIVDFTKISAQHSAQEIVGLLNELFTEFDDSVDHLSLEKIKTIGDCYMVVGGVPKFFSTHVMRCAEMALAMLKILNDFNHRNDLSWKIRIGLHVGPLVAGIIGSKKISYDLWGDTVNIASRLESHGRPNLIHVSDAIYFLLSKHFKFRPRGLTDLKGLGNIQTYELIDEIGT